MNLEIYDIWGTNFGIYSSDEIRKMAICKIESSKLEGPGSVYDKSMGYMTDGDNQCETCGLKKECWGHFGYIELAEPVLHPLYYKIISIFLNCICKQCYRFLLLEEQLEISGISKLKGEKKFNKILEKIEKIEMCAHCSAYQPKVMFKQKESQIVMNYSQRKGETNHIMLSVDEIKKIFENISDDDIKLMGFNPEKIKPINLVFTALPVIPPCSRPFVVSEGNICDDDLTYQTIEIVKSNNQIIALKKQVEEGKNVDQKLQKAIQSLRFRIGTMFDNTKGKAKHPTDNRPIKCFKGRLTGKGGRIRNNLMGKRVDFSGRTVIGAEPTLKLGQVGIPYEITKIHTKPVNVTKFNIDYLQKIVNEGKANYIIKKKLDGTTSRINLQYAQYKKGTELYYGDILVRNCPILKDASNIPKSATIIHVIDKNIKPKKGDHLIRNGKLVPIQITEKKQINIKIGDIVERQIQKGDVVLFNRQPTLHRGGMMAMEIVPMPYKTFRFNLSATKSYNADFDGDEMNIHIPQSYDAEAELRILSSTQNHIISSQNGKPNIVIVQDSLLGAYLMTRYNEMLTKEQFYDISLKGERYDGKPLWNNNKIKTIYKVLKEEGKKPKIFNGKGLISLILPDSLNYECKNDANPEEPIVKIVNGVLVSGTFNKTIIGSSHKSLILVLNKNFGVEITSNFIDNIQFITNAWLLINSFSVGLEDCMITSKESVMSIKDTLIQCYKKAESIEESTQNPGIREVRVTASLSQAKDIGMKIAKDAMSKENNFLVTVNSGAKGDFFNIAQLTGLLGQQNLEGHRVNPLLNHGKRTLVHYPFKIQSKEKEYESRGFIRHSFIRGLNPEEFFFHAMSGRESICDTAMATPNSGYIQRKIVKVCEDIQVRYDQTIRDASGKIYQFAYGETNLDPSKVIKVNGEDSVCDVQKLLEKIVNE